MTDAAAVNTAEIAHDKDVLACRDCGLVQIAPALDRTIEASCSRCGATLAREHRHPLSGGFAWALTALLLAVPAYLDPIFEVTAVGIHHTTRVDGTVTSLADAGFLPLAIPVGLFSIAIPIVWLALLTTCLGILLTRARPKWLGSLFRWTIQLDVWAMPDVFVMGAFVAYTRLQAVARVDIATGGWSFLVFSFAVTVVRVVLDQHYVWEQILPDPKLNPGTDSLLCPDCAMAIDARHEGQPCPRCGVRVHERKPESMARCAALVMAAYALYIPANILPVLSTVRFGKAENHTIFGGAIELVQAGMWPLALIVFMASIFVPVLKLIGLTWFMLAIRTRTNAHLRGRTRLYRVIAAIGRWSNIDVFMIGLLTALVSFGNLTTIEAQPGAIAFAAVVIITMFASHAFDARLMWDAAGERNVR